MGRVPATVPAERRVATKRARVQAARLIIGDALQQAAGAPRAH